MSLEHKHAILDALLTALDEETAREVIDFRQRMGRRYVLTERSAKMLAKQLSRCPDPRAAAEEMIVRGWQGIRPEWVTKDAPLQPVKRTIIEAAMDRLQRAETAH